MDRCSPAMQGVFDKIRAVADTRALVLLLGETGVGKGWLARVVHKLSKRADGPFISVHCGSMPESLFESELFGHERGSFTSADRRQVGKLELGSRGSVLLDEVGTMTLTQQVKLLHVLQEKTFQRIGGRKDIPLEARIIAATNADLSERVARKKFRKDLFFRLNAFPVTIPPLRERPDDIKLLVDHFLAIFRCRHGRDVQGIHPVALEAILRYEWPGNVRELENILERSYLLESSHIIRPETLPLELSCTFKTHNGNCIDTSRPLSDLKKSAVDTIERLYLLKLFEQHNGRMDKTARHAGISTRHLRNLIRKHGISRAEYKHRSG
jgi:DNA-binding NtrC family response regulator